VLDTIENDGLLDRAAATGQQLRDGISAVDHPLLTGVRGTGLWLALQLAGPAAADVQTACREAGFLVNAVQPDAIRLAPPLILTPDEAAAFCAALPAILESAAAVAAVPQGA
jgi:acetylornithine aminotransferase